MVDLDVPNALALASGIALGVLGTLLLLIRPARRPTVFFGLFAVLWGLQVIAANVARIVTSAANVETALLVSFILIPPTFLYLGRFMALFLRPPVRSIVTVGSVGLFIMALGLLIASPQSVLAEVDALPGGGVRVELGWAVVPYFALPFHGLFYVGIAAVSWRLRTAAGDIERGRHRGLLLALALFASHMSVRNLFIFLDPPPFVAALRPWVQQSLVAFYAAGVVLLAVVLARTLFRPSGPVDRGVAAAIAVPAVVALGEVVLRGQAIHVDTVGVWRTLSVGVIVYTLARYQLFDIELRMRWTVRHGTVASIFAAGFFAASELLEQYVPVPGPLLGIIAAGSITLALRPIQNAAERLADRLLPGVQAPDHLAARRVEVYRAALEGILWDGSITSQERSVLSRLQRKLDIDPAQARQLQKEVLSQIPA